MKKLLIAFYFLPFVIFSQINDKYHRARIHYENTSKFQELVKKGLSIEGGKHKKGFFYESDFSDSELKMAKELGLKVEILIEDVQTHYIKQNEEPTIKQFRNTDCNNSSTDLQTPTNFSLGNMGGYFSYEQAIQQMDNMSNLFPNLISNRANISNFQTIEGRPIQWVKLTNNPNQTNSRPQILYTSLHHSREPASLSQLVFFMWYLLENYNTNLEIKNLVDNVELYFILVVNPDGYVRNKTTNPNGGGMWRKNRRNNGDGTFGVDNNRNYDYWENGNSIFLS